MTDFEQPILMRPAVRYGAKRKSPGMLVLYRDTLVHVRSWIPNWCAGLGFLIVAAPSYALTHVGPGALGGAIGAGGGMAIGTAIAKRQAPKKAATGGEDVTIIPLDSITSVEQRTEGRLSGKRLQVSTSPQGRYTFGAKFDQWSADLGSALAARGCGVHATDSGFVVSGPESANVTP